MGCRWASFCSVQVPWGHHIIIISCCSFSFFIPSQDVINCLKPADMYFDWSLSQKKERKHPFGFCHSKGEWKRGCFLLCSLCLCPSQQRPYREKKEGKAYRKSELLDMVDNRSPGKAWSSNQNNHALWPRYASLLQCIAYTFHERNRNLFHVLEWSKLHGRN